MQSFSLERDLHIPFTDGVGRDWDFYSHWKKMAFLAYSHTSEKIRQEIGIPAKT